jgi:V-type H+-transporting ATPase subunit C
LDYLVSTNDQLIKCDAQLESLVKRFMGSIRSVLEEDYVKVAETLTVGDKSPMAYIKSFTWNRMKYRVDVPIADVMNNIVEEAQQVDSLIRSKMVIYSQARSALNTMTRRKQ